MSKKRRRFEYEEGGSRNFWEIQLGVPALDMGDSVTTWWGRIGTDGQSKKLEFDSAEEAQAHYNNLVKEKTKKGYKEVPLEAFFTHVIEVSDQGDRGARDTFGGVPYMDNVDSVPQCRICSSPMALFFQFDIREEFKLPFESGSHLLAFMCPEDNETTDIWQTIAIENQRLPADFWHKDEGHFALILLPPGASSIPCKSDGYVDTKQMIFKLVEDTVEKHELFAFGSCTGFKIGGVPSWINYASTDASCACGGTMRFICQVPDFFDFCLTNGDTDSFLNGNQVVILGCEKQCHPRALIAICDN